MTSAERKKQAELRAEGDRVQENILLLLGEANYAAGTGQREAHERKLVRLQNKLTNLNEQVMAFYKA